MDHVATMQLHMKGISMNTSILTNRRTWILAGITGAVLAGGIAAGSSAAYASDTDPGDSTASDSSATTSASTTVADIATAAEDEEPTCEITSLTLHGDEQPAVWEVEMNCDDDTTKYVEVNDSDGSIISVNDDYTDGSDSSDATTDANDDDFYDDLGSDDALSGATDGTDAA